MPQGISDAGIYGSLIALLWLFVINGFTTWLIVKARNKFKHKVVVNLSDLAKECYGEKAVVIIDILIVLT